MTNNTITVMKKELARFFGDRRLVITTLLLPGIMIYVVYSFLGSAMMKSILPEEAYCSRLWWQLRCKIYICGGAATFIPNSSFKQSFHS